MTRLLCVTALSVCVAMSQVACGGGGSSTSSASSGTAPPPTTSYQVPEQINDGWTTASLQNGPANVNLLQQMVQSIKNLNLAGIQGILIVKDGNLVFEEYFPGPQRVPSTIDGIATYIDGPTINYDRNTLHYLASATKSFASTLIGISEDQGLITSVDQGIFELMPQYGYLNDSAKSKITLDNLLTMTAGLEWDETSSSYGSLLNDDVKCVISHDMYAYVLGKQVIAPPGIFFNYNSGLAHLAGGIVTAVSGSTPDVFAEKNLFAPLQINRYQWDKAASGQVDTGGGLWLIPRDMAKLGQLFLNKGTWNGQRVISEDWVNRATSLHKGISPISAGYDNSYPLVNGYGYFWWRAAYNPNGTTFDAYQAWGLGGQFITVFDKLNMVVVITGDDYNEQYGSMGGMPYINNYILPAMASVP